MVCHSALLLVSLLASFDSCAGIRQVDTIDDGNRVDQLREVLRGVTFRHLFRPVLEGTYHIKRTGGGYLRASDTGRGSSGRSEEVDRCNDKACEWKIQTVMDFGRNSPWPLHKIQAGNSPLNVLPDGAINPGEGGEWYLWLGEDGVHYDFQVNFSSASVAGTWKLEPVRGVGGWFRGPQLKKQWSVVQKLPVFVNTNSKVTWDALCKVGACEETYREERELLRVNAKLVENKHHYITENTVQGICDWEIQSLTNFAHNPNVLFELNKLVPADTRCPAEGVLTATKEAVMQALDFECFSSCSAEIADMLSGKSCETVKQTNWTTFYTQATASNSQCAGLPQFNLEAIGDFEVGQICLKWPEPHLLYQIEDDEPGDLKEQDGLAVCSIEHYSVLFEKDPNEIVQQGSCQAGTTCNCPQTDLNTRVLTSQIRDNNKPKFVFPGSALFGRLATALRDGTIVEVSARLLFMNVGLITGIIHSFQAPPFLAGNVVGSIRTIISTFTDFRCATTVGCWPVHPQKTKSAMVRWWKRACRASPKANDSSSPVWFMPPPLLKYHFQGTNCVLSSCDQVEVQNQKVGFNRDEGKKESVGKPGVYNCQPLRYPSMSEEQQRLYTDALAGSRVFEEYPDAAPPGYRQAR